MYPYLSVCAIFRDEGPHLREWIEFHRLVGAEHFFLYDNMSADEGRAVLDPYVQDGLVTVHDWQLFPGQRSAKDPPWEFQRDAYQHCIETHGAESRWIAFFDIDEFLFSPTGRPLPEILAEYEYAPGVAVCRPSFGTSGHPSRPAGLTVESYVRRVSDDEIGKWKSHFIKSIVHPSRVERAFGAHSFIYKDGYAVTENHMELRERPWSHVESPTFERLRMNHYMTRSNEEYERKLERQIANLGRLRERKPPEWLEALSAQHDSVITMYVPALKQVLQDAGGPASEDTSLTR